NRYNIIYKIINIIHIIIIIIKKLRIKILKAKKKIQPIALKFITQKEIKIFDTPFYFKKAFTSINGKEKVESITLKNVDKHGNIISNKEEIVPVDFVSLSGGLTPLTEILVLLNVSFTYIESLGG